MRNQALKELIQKDYQEISKKYTLPLEKEVQQVLIPQTIFGHAHEGHTTFSKNSYLDITMDDIFTALGFDPIEKREFREHLIYEVKDCLDELLHGRINKLVNKKGKPILGMSFLNEFELSLSKETFKGVPLAGRMDSNFWRGQTLCEYPSTLEGNILNIGFGKEYLINSKKAKEWELTKDFFAHQEHSFNSIQTFKSLGLIVEKGEHPYVENVFVRQNHGFGCCDDACLTSIGRLHGPDALLLAWAIDAIDTYSKCTKTFVEGGFDEFIGKDFEKKWFEHYKEDLVTPEETTEIIYLGAKNNDPFIGFSSSHIRFNEIGHNQLLPTFLNHYYFTKFGIIPEKYGLGFNRTSSDVFYDAMEKRFKLFGKGGLK